jgi:hypothetical protein
MKPRTGKKCNNQYTQDYYIVLSHMIEAVGGMEIAPTFMKIGGSSASWIVPFLKASKHHYTKKILPIDYSSLHFYARCTNCKT